MVRRNPFTYLCRSCLQGVGLCVLWLLWLVLIGGIALQLRLYFTQTLFVPEFALRKLEDKLSERGFAVHFEALQLDKGGHIALHGVTAKPTRVPGPSAYFDRVDLTVSPWLALAGFIEPTAVHVEGGRIVLPAILSPSGAEEDLMKDLSLDARPEDDRWHIATLQGTVRGAYVRLSGTLPDIKRFRKGDAPALPASDVQRARAQLWRRVGEVLPTLERIEGATLSIQLSDSGGEGMPKVDVLMSGASVIWPIAAPQLSAWVPAIEAHNWELKTSASLDSLMDRPLPLVFRAEEIKAGAEARANHVQVDTQLDFGRGRGPINDIRVTAASITARSATLTTPVIHLSGSWPKVGLTVRTRVAGQSLELGFHGDAAQRSGVATLRSAVSADVLRLVDQLTGRTTAKLLQPSGPAPLEATAEFSSGGKLEQLSGWLSSGPVVVRNVALDHAEGELMLKGRSLEFHQIKLKTAKSRANGSYISDTATRRFRFLLEGSLEPADIDGWFTSWWPRFWTTFAFASPPAADIDIQGVWGDAATTNLFLSVTAEEAKVLTAPFDRVFTTLYVKPQYFDVQWMDGHFGKQRVTGSFDRASQNNTNALASMRFDVESDLPFDHYRAIFKADAEKILEAFTFANPPKLQARGLIKGPANPGGPGRDLDITVNSTDSFTLYDFPLDGVQATGRIEGQKITLPQVTTGFAGGTARGNVVMDGPDDQRTLRFEARLESANLGKAIVTLENFGNRDTPGAAPAAMNSRFQQRIAEGNLNVTMSASGSADDPYSYQGSGLASISGAKLAEINLLGQLSQALKSVPWLNFTSFALNDVESKFKLDRQLLYFDTIKLAGPSAHITAHGQYDLRMKSMGIDATFYPFGQSRNILGSAMDLVLTPLSSALEMRLEGSLDKPKWHFVLGPTSLLRRLSGQGDRTSTPKPAQDAQPSPLLRRQ